MTGNVRSFVRQVDDASVPDLWDDIRSRRGGPPPDLGRGRRLAAVAVGIVVAIGAVAIAYTAFRVDKDVTGGTPTPSVQPSPIPVPMGEPRITAEIPIPEDSLGLGVAVGAGSAWVGVGHDMGQAEGEVIRIDLATNEIVARVPVRQASGRITATDDAVWIASHAVLERIDPATNAVVAEVQIPGRQISAIAADATDVWAIAIADVSEDGSRGAASLVRIDPARNEVIADIPLGSQLTGYQDEIQIGLGAVWVLGVRWVEPEDAEYGSDLIRVDPSTNQIVARVPVGGFHMVVGPDEVWAKFPADGVFDETADRWAWTRVDVRTNQASESFTFEDDGLQLVSREALWSVGYDEQENVRVTRFDPGTLQVEARSEPIRSYFTGAALDPASGTVWIAAVRGIVRVDIAS